MKVIENCQMLWRYQTPESLKFSFKQFLKQILKGLWFSFRKKHSEEKVWNISKISQNKSTLFFFNFKCLLFYSYISLYLLIRNLITVIRTTKKKEKTRLVFLSKQLLFRMAGGLNPQKWPKLELIMICIFTHHLIV